MRKLDRSSENLVHLYIDFPIVYKVLYYMVFIHYIVFEGEKSIQHMRTIDLIIGEEGVRQC